MNVSLLSFLIASFNTWKTLRGKFIPLNYSQLNLDDEYLMFEVAGILEQKYNLDDSPKSAERLKKVAQERRFIAPLARYINEVTNGGHHQFFWNSNGSYNDLVLEGLHYYNHDDLAANFQQSLAVYHGDDSMHGADFTSLRDMSRKFSSSAKERNYDIFDDSFFEQQSGLEDHINASIRKEAKR
jgi:hypothetical protein